ncbi:TMEM175 family protein [Blastococcus sp. URHD0036]|uniref:TMEM175 family protein n=1 Tax=Blastococcus sp. URHD0036 TaxID=1380356 RepID=UPI0004951F4E|nr:TMEM175 family protein [Blastococcus sp. URHD0036]
MRTSRGLDRLITFLDAVVAIAITLLVLPLVDVLDEDHEQSLSTVLSDNAGRFGAFLLSFVVIARLWRAHHAMFERVGGYDPVFVSLNFGWLLTIVFLPFATQVAAVYGGQDRLAVALYLGTVAISSVLLAVMSLLIGRRDALRRDDVRPEHATPPGWWTTSALLLVAFVLGVAVPAVNYWATLLLLLSAPVEHAVQRRAGAVPVRE